MDGSIAPGVLDHAELALSGGLAALARASAFGTQALPARALEPGMGLAVARRTVFRPQDAESFGRVADRVAAGNMSLLGRSLIAAEQDEQARLRNAIATGSLLTSGRHLQHGDAEQAGRNMEVFTNCATAIASFAKFYLLLNGSGVGRAYDDELMAVDWAEAPEILLHLDPAHPDYPKTDSELRQFAAELSLLPGAGVEADIASVRAAIGRALLPDLAILPAGARLHRIADSREGWAKALEELESLAFQRASGLPLVFDLSAIRPKGAPIRGMQGRPASGPVSLLRALLNIRRHVIEPARARAGSQDRLSLWEQAMLVDHHLSVEVQVGGARRAARMATKSWRDPGIFRFIRCKSEGGLWTANNSVMVDHDFWRRVAEGKAQAAEDALTRHAVAVFDEVTRCAYINGEPGLINGDRLEDLRTGSARAKPVHEDGRDFRSGRYQVDHAHALLADLSRRANAARFPVTTNPCGEIVLHVTGGYCVIADFAPLLACPGSPDEYVPGCLPEDEAALWDARVVESVRLGVRFLIRANTMDALYAEEVRRTNRIGIGPTGLHEWAWVRFGLSFTDLLDEARSRPFWDMLSHLSAVAKAEANQYAAELGTTAPFTVTTVKPAGTTSKLFGLTEGAHLPARRQYLRWVMFQGSRNADGTWATASDPLLADYEARGYPVRCLTSFPNMSIVGFPTLPLIQRLGLGEQLVTAPEASPEQHYRWLELLERHWIGAERGNQVSYTLKVFTDRHGLDSFRDIVLHNQPRIRCCAVLPSRPDHELGYEYLPEEEVAEDRFAEIVAGIEDPALHEMIDLAHLQCASGVCPI
ncbi:Recombinase [Rhodovastum atsumiense]|uniref:Recombinase n=1 Tax=Rhodovastum atsumiense TaxID=504468 RepID=A0A5M6J1K3_9PROT|nr:recombinase [Rhodovastum atsumiense]KAA5614384.1 recombinase [Rhodovastum atsumiense]CAH2604861.1 Recombinase [Rhodovastum atsumiense]